MKTYDEIIQELVEYVENCSKADLIALYKHIFDVELEENDDLTKFEVISE